MERRLNVSKEKTDEYDEEWNDPRDESIERQSTNMLIDGNEENLPLMDFSNQNVTHLPEFGFASGRFAFPSFTQETFFHASSSGPYADIQSLIFDTKFDEATSLSPTSGIRQIPLSLQSNDIAPDSTHRNVPDSSETVSSSSYQQNNGEISAPFSHGVANQVRISDILLENEICLPPYLQENNMEPILCPTRTNTETLDGNFCRVIFPIIDTLHEQNTTIDDCIVYDVAVSNSDQAVEVSSSTNDYDPQEGTSTMNVWVSPDSTNRNVPDNIETGPSGLCEQHNRDVSASFSHAAVNQVSNTDILLNDEIRLPQSLEQIHMEPLFYRTDTDTETLDGNFFLNWHNIDLQHEQSTTIVDPIAYDDVTVSNRDKAVEVSSCTKDYDPQEGTSTMNLWVSQQKFSNLFPQKEFCNSDDLNAVLKQHSLSGDDKIDDSSRNDAGLADISEDTSPMKTQAQLNRPIQIHKVEKPYKCEIRGKTFTQKGSLKRHPRTHSSGSPHECDICGKRLASTYRLKRHILTHSDDKRHECKICGKRFKQKQYLECHIRTHSDKRPYECQTCGKRFKEKRCLTGHIQTHSDKKPYECEICDKKFAQQVSLDRHIRTHSDKKPYACETCGKRFTRKDTLSKHSKKHTSADPFKCEICGEVFSDVDSLNGHRRTHHEK